MTVNNVKYCGPVMTELKLMNTSARREEGQNRFWKEFTSPPSHWLGTRCSWAARSLDDLYFIGQNWFGLSSPRKHLFMSRTHGVWLKTPNTKTTFVIYVKFDTRIIHWLHLLILKFKTYIRCCSRNGQRCLLEVGSVSYTHLTLPTIYSV